MAKKIQKPDIEQGQKIVSDLMAWLQIPITESTKDTPFRVAKMYSEELFLSLYTNPPAIKTFIAEGSSNSYVCVTDIYFTSYCEHHLMPFSGKCGIIYSVNKKDIVIGLSKLARIVSYWSAQPQLQERLQVQIAQDIMKRLKPNGVFVAMSAEHSCMTIRGIKARGSKTNTSILFGDIDKDESLRLLQIHKFFD